ncbi:MAG: glycoside hydrolase family 127 protein [Bacteroidales bacterium]|nr:glycoside hydrolase family 127 protein [Bacteroidales bacterium]
MKKRMQNSFGIILPAMIIWITACSERPKTTSDYPIKPVPFTSVAVKDKFWAPRIKRNHVVTIPIAFEQSEETGRVKNFKIAGGLEEGEFCSIYPFDDSDVFKIIEGASYSLQTLPDPKLEAYLDTLIYYIGLAQEEDGYLFTIRTIMGDDSHPWVGSKRWEKTHILSHELYNLGHMYEAAVAHYQATGKRNFLDIALKSADLVDREFGWDKIENYPGHQEIEIGLVKLYRLTGEQKYLDLAKFFLDVRGPGGEEYNQAHKKVTEQDSAVGHAVRAAYMYSGIADVAALTNDKAYVDAISRIWEDIVYRKIYITGGIGAAGGNEGFAEPYHLPNLTAYCETCASIANVFWNHRMFLHKGEVKYYDVLERTLYNALLSGVSLSGNLFFYPNRLESYGQHERQEWFGCACCPSNICRFIPSVPGYIYGKTKDRLYVNLYVDNTANIDLSDQNVEIIQETNYPWEGQIKLTINPEEVSSFKLYLRIPGWARNEAIPSDLYHFTNISEEEIVVYMNDKKRKASIQQGYLIIDRKWETGDVVELIIPMPVRKIVAHDAVEEDKDKVAIQRGPIIFCAEGKNVEDGHVMNLILDPESQMGTRFEEDLLNGVQVVTIKAGSAKQNLEKEIIVEGPREIKLIPYHVWANRGPAEMIVWLPVTIEVSHPTPAPTIAYRSTVTGSHPKANLNYIKDQMSIKHSNDRSIPYYHWWPRKDQMEWLQYTFEKPETVSGVKVYWFDDRPNGGCRIPASWEVFYDSGNGWKPVQVNGEYTFTKDDWDEIEFEAVTTGALRLQVKLSKEFSSGIYEWEVW